MPKSPAATKNTVAHGNEALTAAIREARGYVQKIRDALAPFDLHTLTEDERLHTNGKLRKDEPGAMRSILDAVDAAPGTFESLAPHDHGSDSKRVETAPARQALAHVEIVAPLADDLAELARDVGDDLLAAASEAKDVTVPAYAILRANADLNPKLRAAGKKALDFYGGFGRRRVQAAKRAVSKAKKAAKTAPTK